VSLLWKIGGAAAALLAAYLLVTMYGGARYKSGKADEAAAWQKQVAAQERNMADLRAENERLGAAALNKYVERIETFKPVLVTNKETVTRYAQTPAGAVQCLSAERVLGITETRTALFPSFAKTPGQSDPALPPDSAAERRDDQR
jgi:hypothetical protein